MAKHKIKTGKKNIKSRFEPGTENDAARDRCHLLFKLFIFTRVIYMWSLNGGWRPGPRTRHKIHTEAHKKREYKSRFEPGTENYAPRGTLHILVKKNCIYIISGRSYVFIKQIRKLQKKTRTTRNSKNHAGLLKRVERKK